MKRKKFKNWHYVLVELTYQNIMRTYVWKTVASSTDLRKYYRREDRIRRLSLRLDLLNY